MKKRSLFLLGTGAAIGFIVGKYGDQIVAKIKETAEKENFEKLLKDLEERKNEYVREVKETVKSKEEDIKEFIDIKLPNSFIFSSDFTNEKVEGKQTEVESEEVEMTEEEELRHIEEEIAKMEQKDTKETEE